MKFYISSDVGFGSFEILIFIAEKSFLSEYHPLRHKNFDIENDIHKRTQ